MDPVLVRLEHVMDRWMSDPAAASSGGRRFLIPRLGLPWHQTCPDSYTLLIDNEPLDEYLREANRATRPKDMAGPDTVERRNPRSVRLSEAGQVRHPVPEPGSRVCCARAAAHAAQSQRLLPLSFSPQRPFGIQSRRSAGTRAAAATFRSCTLRPSIQTARAPPPCQTTRRRRLWPSR